MEACQGLASSSMIWNRKPALAAVEFVTKVDNKLAAYESYFSARSRHKVGRRSFECLLSSWSEQKKEENGRRASLSRSQIVKAMVVLPSPANPVSQYTGGAFAVSFSFTQAMIWSMMWTRVPFVHRRRARLSELMAAL